MMTTMSRDWARLADVVKAARTSKGLTQVTLAEAAGVSEATVQNLEAGGDRRRLPSSLPKVERALGWRPGSGEAVLAGGDPELIGSATQEGFAGLRAAGEPAAQTTAEGYLPLRIVQELSDEIGRAHV